MTTTTTTNNNNNNNKNNNNNNRRSSAATGDARETAFLFQRISTGRTSAVHCGTHTWVFCRTWRRAGPLTNPTCVLASDFSRLAFYTIGKKIKNK